MAYEHILMQQEGGIATLTLNRPATLNALNRSIVAELIDAFDRVRDEHVARALLITGAGRAFSSGAELAGGLPQDCGAELETHYNPLLERLMALPLPVICAVNGPAAGAGCSLALAADIVLAARSAYFLQAFINIGLVPDVGSTWMLPRIVGRARAQAMMLLGERIPAERAEQWGMIYRCVDDAALGPESLAIATKLANGPTRAYALLRQALRESLECSLTESLQIERTNQWHAGRTQDFLEGVTAFLGKRPPSFQGK
ncbi:MAG TPA: enoyl-CoA hydratase-related protein [Steroidobacteraceae bacterium]|nr:enoyl-CoA hydratase-related protein [Steroidobacteraceae bacterium]